MPCARGSGSRHLKGVKLGKTVKRFLDLYLKGVAAWMAGWLVLGDWGIVGMANSWAFWLLSLALPLGAARLASRRSPLRTLLAAGWLAGGGALLLSRYPWLRRNSWRHEPQAGRQRATLPDAPADAAALGPAAVRELRLFSLNVLKENQNADAVLAAIRRALPDVVLVQELEPSMSRRLYAGLAEYNYCHWQCHYRPGGGFGFFSRYPFEITGSWDWPATRPYAVRITVDLPGGPVDLYNVHLLSIGPGALRKTGFTGNFRAREAQVDLLVREIAERGRPALALGDCNFTEGNAAYWQASARLQDAWLVAGHGAGWTWPRQGFPPWVPVLRLDYCFCTPDVRPAAMRVLRQRSGSDHCPIVVDVAL
jgi:endonuclease/exonuclease/phosphatase (EEP) superfamily protein YafD